LRKNYFAKYIKSVYNIEKYLIKLKDGRVNQPKPSQDIIIFLSRLKSRNEMNCMLKGNQFKNAERTTIYEQ
jgi:hypothetical protein